ncbi:DNA methyltransferase family protein [Flagellimonas baculiformis]|uniref:hypothetical protein n=1 Tax=Flagellimonas baculiformis TaxID=3067310 RepID=UPI00296FA668|nr:hypothetical protein [Muricauda sp. D6]
MIDEHANYLVRKVSEATMGSSNEANLRHGIEVALEQVCSELHIGWTPFSLEKSLSLGRGGTKFADVVHGALIIEYEPPKSFGGREGAKFKHACGQAEEYAELMHLEEGRPLNEYIMVSWDGESIAFGRYGEGGPDWERLTNFDMAAATRIISFLENDGKPLVHPRILSTIVGPESDIGNQLTPKFFQSIVDSLRNGTASAKTKLLYTEWRRLFGQVVGVQSDQLKELLKRQGMLHDQHYVEHVGEYLFSLNTYIALIAKIVAALSLPRVSQDILDSSVPIRGKLMALEDGSLFADAGISNMLIGDFFSWYLDDPNYNSFEGDIQTLLNGLNTIDFDVTRKSSESTRDLFKGMYESFVPRELRHALGEVYTPDWLASHALDDIGWLPENDLLDPTCGTGTFILEALKRRLLEFHNNGRAIDCGQLLRGLYGIDLNPLAVLAARTSLVVFLAPLLDTSKPVKLPIFLADAINSADERDNTFEHTIQTEKGPKIFKVPTKLIRSSNFYPIFLAIKDLVNANLSPEAIYSSIMDYKEISEAQESEQQYIRDSIQTLHELHREGWDGIWCSILADRFSAGAIRPVSHICGNPPWVKWSHLPPDYANFIKEKCMRRGVFSDDRWVGGIESDISTVVTYEAIAKWLANDGILAFFITGTVFVNESSQGFRRFQLADIDVECSIIKVEDYKSVAPFEGVTNHPTMLVVQRDRKMEYPIPYIIWEPALENGKKKKRYASSEEFVHRATPLHLLAKPVAGTDAGPWIVGTRSQQEYWDTIFDAASPAAYIARKGVTTDRNGIFFVRVEEGQSDECWIVNDPSVGRTTGIPVVRKQVEKTHVFPLIRGRGVSAFSAEIDPDYKLLIPQREMHGDPSLPTTAPKTYRFLRSFKDILENRSSYKRFQKGQPYWSLWSTGPYTFSPFKVLWKEMSGGRFAAAYIGAVEDTIIGTKLVIPDHKLYFVPMETEAEAAFLTGILNSPKVAEGISAYGSQLSLGVSVVEYLNIPKYDPGLENHKRLSDLAIAYTARGEQLSESEKQQLSEVVDSVLIG